MTQFEKITESPEVLAAFLAALPVIDGPWDKEFQKWFCAGCAATDCDACPHAAERNNPGWWLSLSAGPDVKPGRVVIDLDPAEPEKPMTAEEKEEMERMRPMFRYFISDSEELTESEISEMEATEEEKAVCRFLAKYNPENRVIEVGMLGKTSILLHGAADVEKVYFCHPYSSYERGSNECQNKMIRRPFPKGTDFGNVTDAEVARAESWMNNYPRKILGWKTSEMLFREYVAALI